MNIKRVILFITIIALSLGLLACSSGSMRSARESELSASNDDKIADTCFQKIREALENKDKEELKKIFSPNALKEAKDIDDGIDYIMEFYKGKIKSKINPKDVALQVSDLNENGQKTSELKAYYTVTTDEDIYLVFFIYQKVDKKNPDNVGLYMLQIIKESDIEKEFDWGNNIRCAGIYLPTTKENK